MDTCVACAGILLGFGYTRTALAGMVVGDVGFGYTRTALFGMVVGDIGRRYLCVAVFGMLFSRRRGKCEGGGDPLNS